MTCVLARYLFFLCCAYIYMLRQYLNKNRTTLLGLAGLGVLQNKAVPPTEPDALVEPSTSTAKGAAIVAGIGNLNADNSDRERGAQLNVMARAHGGVDPSVGIGRTQSDSATETVTSRVSQNLAADVAMIGNNNGNEYGTVSPSAEGPPSNDAASMPASEPTMTLEQMHDKLFDQLDHARTGTLAGKKVNSIRSICSTFTTV